MLKLILTIRKEHRCKHSLSLPHPLISNLCSLDHWTLSQRPLSHPYCLELKPPGFSSPSSLPSSFPLLLYFFFFVTHCNSGVGLFLWTLPVGKPGEFLDSLSPSIFSLNSPDSGCRKFPASKVVTGSCLKSRLVIHVLTEYLWSTYLVQGVGTQPRARHSNSTMKLILEEGCRY